MFERYTERAHRVLFFARYESSQRGSLTIEPEHLLLGLIREGSGITARLLTRSNVSVEGLRQQIEDRIPHQATPRVSHEIPFSRRAKSVLKAATEEADRLLHNYIGPQHLLLGLLSVDSSLAASVLFESGSQLPAVRDALVSQLHDRPATHRAGDELTPDRMLAHLRARRSSAPVVYVIPTEMQDQKEIRGHEVWALRGLALRSALERASSFPPTRIELPPALDTSSTTIC